MKLICVGKIKDKNIQQLVDEYLKRIKLNIIEIKDSTPEKEAEKILELLEKRRAFLIALSEEGVLLDSEKFAEKIRQETGEGNEIVFVIGGPFGLSEKVKEKTDFLLSLSKLTFTHEIARLFLVEQIYRATTIIQRKSYHK